MSSVACAQCGASPKSRDDDACAYCGALLPHAEQAARRAAQMRELLADRSGDGLPDIVSDLVGSAHGSNSSTRTVQTDGGASVVIHTSTSSVTTRSVGGQLVGGQLPAELPEEIRQQIAGALGQHVSAGAVTEDSTIRPRQRNFTPIIVTIAVVVILTAAALAFILSSA